MNEMHAKGFVSIGCEPCTIPILPNQHEREGRWAWEVRRYRSRHDDSLLPDLHTDDIRPARPTHAKRVMRLGGAVHSDSDCHSHADVACMIVPMGPVLPTQHKQEVS